jgi:hypothetical protein
MRDVSQVTTVSSTQGHDSPDDDAPVEGLRRGRVLAGRYEIEALLGRGATASVYCAYDRVGRQRVALKALDLDKSGSSVWIERPARELRHARAVEHPNVCRVYDFFESDGQYSHGPVSVRLRDATAVEVRFAPNL